MKNDIICKRKFGKNEISITKNGSITITGEWFTAHGVIYDHQIQNFKDDVINPCTGFHVQIIGMDTYIAKTHSNYIYNRIKAGCFDHLIPKD